MKKTLRELRSYQDLVDFIAALRAEEPGTAFVPACTSSEASENLEVHEYSAEAQELLAHLKQAEDVLFRVFVEIFKLAEATMAQSNASNAEPAPTTPDGGE